MSSDAYHMTQPEPTGSGAMIAMENAVLNAILIVLKSGTSMRMQHLHQLEI